MNQSNSLSENTKSRVNSNDNTSHMTNNKFLVILSLFLGVLVIISAGTIFVTLKSNSNQTNGTASSSNSNQYSQINSDLISLSSSSISSLLNSSSSVLNSNSSSSSSIQSQSSSVSSVNQVGFNLSFDARVKFYGSTTNFVLTSGNFLDTNYKINDKSNTHTIAYAVSDSKLYAEFVLPYESGPGSPKVINITDLGHVEGLGNIKRFNYQNDVYDASSRLYTNQEINYVYNPEGAPNPPTVNAYIANLTNTNLVYPTCKPLNGTDFTNCDNLIKSLKFITKK